MAIEKTYFGNNIGSSFSTWANVIAEYLKENAVPEYFSKVINDNNVVKCYVGDWCFLSIHPTDLSKNYKTCISPMNRGAVYLCVNSASSTYYIEYAHKCKNGIAFSLCNSSGGTYNWAFLITKDNEGNTTIVTTSTMTRYTCSSSTTDPPINKLYVINPNVNNVQLLQQVYTTCSGLDKVSMCPFVVGGQDSGSTYTPNAFYMPFSPSSAQCTIDINGVKYMTNGAWCIKDE